MKLQIWMAELQAVFRPEQLVSHGHTLASLQVKEIAQQQHSSRGARACKDRSVEESQEPHKQTNAGAGNGSDAGSDQQIYIRIQTSLYARRRNS